MCYNKMYEDHKVNVDTVYFEHISRKRIIYHASRTFFVSGQAQHGFSFFSDGGGVSVTWVAATAVSDIFLPTVINKKIK